MLESGWLVYACVGWNARVCLECAYMLVESVCMLECMRVYVSRRVDPAVFRCPCYTQSQKHSYCTAR